MQIQTQTTSTPLVFLTSMFNDTMQLLHVAQEYFARGGAQAQEEATPVEKLIYSSEMSRITLRLASVMAWLLARRAELSGQISREEALSQFRLAFGEVCLTELPEGSHTLPQMMCSLLERSLELYRRASRLDKLLAVDILPEAEPREELVH